MQHAAIILTSSNTILDTGQIETLTATSTLATTSSNNVFDFYFANFNTPRLRSRGEGKGDWSNLCEAPAGREKGTGPICAKHPQAVPANWTCPFPARQFHRTSGNHLIGIHVARRTRTGLINIDRKLIVQLSVGHFPACGENSGRLRCGEQAQIAVHRSRRPFHQSQGVDQLQGQRLAGNREVLDRPLC